MDRRTVAAVLALGSAAALLASSGGCGDDGPSKPGDTASPLVFTREDSSEIQFASSARAWVWCGPWEDEVVPVPAVHVWFGSLVEVAAPRWELKAVSGDFSSGDTLRFPNHFIWDQPDSAHIFLYDRPNELSTDQEDASGWIVFHKLPCPGGQEVEFEIDAVLGSELGGMPTVAVRGRFRHVLTDPPPWIRK